MPEILDLKGIKKDKNGELNHSQLLARMEVQKPTITGDAVEWYKKVGLGKKAVIFCASVAMSKKCADEFNSHGFNFVSLDGTMTDQERDDAVRMLDSGELDGITSCDIVSEGFDCPNIEYVGLLRPTMSEGLYLQQMGRGLRSSPGKTHCIVVDHVGNVDRFLPPHFPREWSLEKGIIKTRENSLIEIPKIRTCPKCFSVFEPTKICPECGHVFVFKERKIATVNGKLIELTPEIEAEMIARKQKKAEQGTAKTLEELLVIEKARGYKKGWARHIFNNRR
jgi:superfamily II DNA or RNA helicase